MDVKEFESLVRRHLSEGLDGEEAFELELEAHVDPAARARLEQAERDDTTIHLLPSRLQELSRSGLGKLAGASSLEPTAWYQTRFAAMAASALVTLAVTLTLVDFPPGNARALASSSLVYLETQRSASPESLPSVSFRPDDEYVTLVAFPAIEDFADFRVKVERFDGETDAVAADDDAWTVVWEGASGPPQQDSIQVMVSRDSLAEGIYRLRIDGRAVSADKYASAAAVLFRVVAAEQ